VSLHGEFKREIAYLGVVCGGLKGRTLSFSRLKECKLDDDALAKAIFAKIQANKEVSEWVRDNAARIAITDGPPQYFRGKKP
jgi:hypothetical protein